MGIRFSHIQRLEVIMAKEKKVPLQTYLESKERDDFVAICEEQGVSAASKIRVFIKGEIKKHKDLK